MLAMSPTSADLPPCPASPNCVSSQAGNSGQRVEPFAFTMHPDKALARLKQVLQEAPRTTIVAEEGSYLHAEARSFLFRFVDDVEFKMDTDNRVIHVRSASRTGFSDLGVNRRRVERLRRAFNDTQ
ncbi:MAG: DUF1499 domain-containing protein [Halobacteria archaeon]|nr:DUF1499 domain-containing protein [Halobacteria archaeon]